MKQFEMPIIFWLMTIEDDKIRGQALENLNPHEAAELTISSRWALVSGFTWAESPQGHQYWEDIWRNL